MRTDWVTYNTLYSPRWDFDTAEEYADYMGNKEAMPKAAFQYGMKMNDGRKTRGKVGTKKNEKAKLDREWNQILGVINKRKGGDGGGANKKQKHNDDDWVEFLIYFIVNKLHVLSDI